MAKTFNNGKVEGRSYFKLFWEQTYASLTSALAERLLTQEDCMVYRAEGATVARQGITA